MSNLTLFYSEVRTALVDSKTATPEEIVANYGEMMTIWNKWNDDAEWRGALSDKDMKAFNHFAKRTIAYRAHTVSLMGAVDDE